MASKPKDTARAEAKSELFAALNSLEGKSGAIDPTELDARLLWQVVVILFARRASIQIGVTQDGGSWSVQFWDGKFPEKRYFRDTYELNRTLAAIVVIDGGKELSQEWREICGAYGW